MTLANIDRWLKADKDKRLVVSLLRSPGGHKIQAAVTDPTGPSTEVFAVAWGEGVDLALRRLDEELGAK